MVLNPPVLSSTNLLSAWTPHSQTQQWAVYPSNHQHKWTLPLDSHRGRCRDLQVLQPRKLHKGGGVQVHSCMPAGMQAVELCTQPRHAPCRLPLVNELQRAHSSLRCSGFERELRNYPDKAFVTWLLDAIDNGVSIGYSGPRTPHTSHNSKIELCRHTLALF